MSSNVKTHSVFMLGLFPPGLGKHYKHRNLKYSHPRSETVSESAYSFLESTVESFDKQDISIVDFGGGVGANYMELKRKTKKTFSYNIIELAESFREFDSEVQYHEDVTGVDEHVDIFYSDATLHLTNNTALETLDKFCSVAADIMVLPRCIFNKNGIYFSSYAYGLDLCFDILSKDKFEEHIKSYGYIVDYVKEHDDQKFDVFQIPDCSVDNLDAVVRGDPLMPPLQTTNLNVVYFDYILRKND